MRSISTSGLTTSDDSSDQAARTGAQAGDAGRWGSRWAGGGLLAVAALGIALLASLNSGAHAGANHGADAGRILSTARTAFPTLAASWDRQAQLTASTQDLAGLTRHGWLPTSAADTGFSCFFAQDFSHGGLVKAGSCLIEQRPLAAAATQGAVVDGKLVYADAYQSTDVVYTIGGHASEEFLVLRDAQAPTRFTTRLQAASGAAALVAVTPTAGGLLVSAADGSHARIAAPYVVDATGRRSAAATWQVAAGRDHTWEVSLQLDARGLSYPLVIDPSWFTPDALTHARYEHTASLLADGKLLVVGGLGTSGDPLTSCELFTPASGTWSATGALATARAAHTATVLSDGTVLVVGGVDTLGAATATCELYDPSAGTWTTVGSLTLARQLHTATLLADGTVLVAGGEDVSFSETASCEIYDPVAKTWSATGTLNRPRGYHTATALSDGSVLVVGGFNDGDLTDCEVYDPIEGTWTSTGSTGTAHSLHTATLLADGTVLVAGGYSGGSTCELYDAQAGTWSTTGSLSNGPVGHTATTLPGGKVLITGGTDSAGSTYFTDAQRFNPGSGVWTELTLAPLGTARAFHTATLLNDGQVLVVGGSNTGGVMTSVEEFDPITHLTVSGITASDRTYDGTTAVGISTGEATLVGVDPGDAATVFLDATSAAATVATPTAGSEKTVTVTGLSLTGSASVGYVLDAPTGLFINIAQADQLITFPTVPTQDYSGSSFTVALGATSDSGLGVTYQVLSGPATVAGSTLTITGSGTVVIEADQAGDINYTEAIPVSQSVTVNDTVPPPLALSGATSGTYGQSLILRASGGVGTYTVSATGGSASLGQATSDQAGPYTPVTVTPSAAGSLVVTLQDSASHSTAWTITVAKASQTITFPKPADQDFSGSSFTLTLGATSSSGLVVTYTVQSGPATVSGSTLTITGSGTVALHAHQAGNANYLVASIVPQSVLVNDTVPPPLALSGPTNGTFGQTTTLRASGGQGTYTVSATGGSAALGQATSDQTGPYTPVTVTPSAAGALVVTLHDGASHTASATITVAKASQTITFPAIGTTFFGGLPRTISLAATADSGLAVSFAVLSGPGTVSGSTLTITGAGSITVAAKQAGNANYAAASDASQAIAVTDTTPPPPAVSGVSTGLVAQALTLRVSDGLGAYTISATSAVTILGTATSDVGGPFTPLTVIPKSAGTLVVTVSDVLHRSATASITITELPVATQPTPVVSLSTSSQTLFGSICPGSTVGVTSLRNAFVHANASVSRGFTWDAPSQTYRELPAEPAAGLTATDGVFLASRVAVALDFSGPAMPPGATLVLYPGWNFVGLGPVQLTSSVVVPDHDLLAEFDYTDLDGAAGSQSDVSAAYLWDGTSYSATTLIASGKGYFIKNVSSPAKTLLLSRRDVGPSPRAAVRALARGLARDVGAPPAIPSSGVTAADSGNGDTSGGGSCGGGSGTAVLLTGLLACLGWRARRTRR